jgi:hypothetical protein
MPAWGMVGRKWLLIGVVLGVAVALGHVPFLAGAGRVLAETALSLVASGGTHLIRAAARTGAPERVVLGFESLVAVLAPGVTALLLVVGARGTLRVRAVAGVLLAVLGVASFFYHPAGVASGVVTLALIGAAIAVAASGPLVAAPLAALAGLIGAAYLPRLVTHARVERAAIEAMHQAVFGHGGDPLLLRLVLVVVAIVPFALALRYVLRR